MWRLSIRWLLLGVAAATLILPLLAIVGLRRLDAALVRQTERELNAQGALIAAYAQQVFAELSGEEPGDPRHPNRSADSYVPLAERIESLSELAPAVPDPLPTRAQELPARQAAAFERLNSVLRNAQVFNLSGVRVLDESGCTVASTRALGECHAELPEVKRALSGVAASALRQRVSDEPKPTYSSLSRRGDLRVFVALPVYDRGNQIGVVWLSRTAESGLEWLFKQRREAFFGGLLAVSLAACVSLAFSLLITKPLSRMKRLLESTDGTDLRLREVPAPAEIHTLGVALDERTAQLEEKSKYIEQFAANVSHELKTPLTSIRGAVELMREEGGAMSEQQRQRFLENIDAAASRTDRLVTRLLHLARLEARHEDDEEQVMVENWVRSLPERYGDGVHVELSSDLHVECSLGALESVVGNLVDNALRYRQQRPVQVCFEQLAGSLHISVTDDGPGISDDNQKHLFERFFTTERDRGGTGLGLPIVLATARARGGRVEVTSSGLGTRVDVWM